MTYEKPLKIFQGTTLMGTEFSAVDTETSRLGNDAISAFEAHKAVKGENILVPFHAIKKAEYGTTTQDTEKADPYCG